MIMCLAALVVIGTVVLLGFMLFAALRVVLPTVCALLVGWALISWLGVVGGLLALCLVALVWD